MVCLQLAQWTGGGATMDWELGIFGGGWGVVGMWGDDPGAEL